MRAWSGARHAYNAWVPGRRRPIYSVPWCSTPPDPSVTSVDVATGSRIDRGRTAVRRAYFKNRSLRLPLNAIRSRGIRPNDLFVASYPRSGTTWLRFLLFELLTGTPAEFVPVNESIPYVGKHRGAPALLPSGGRVIQTHETFLRGIRSAIYLVRDPRSVVLSEYRWQLRTGLFEGSFESFFDAFMSGRANPYGRWDRHVDTWMSSRLAAEGRLHLVRFVDLRTDAVAELTRILDFLGVRRPTALIEAVVANNGLEEMRLKEERAPEGALGARTRADIRFVQSGSTSAWRDELSQGQARAIEERFEPTFRRVWTDRPAEPTSDEVAGTTASTATSTHPLENENGVKVLYIAGWGRSGSTLLDTLLGQIDGFLSTGELRYVWERGVIGDWICGCQRSVKTCPLWSRVLDSVNANRDAEARKIVDWQRQATRFRHTRGLLNRTSNDLGRDGALDSYITVMQQLFAAIREATGARVIVDSSKRPSDAAALTLVPNLQLYVVHLVRDPRAVAHSWRRRQPGIDRHGVVNSTISWAAWNLMSDGVRSKLPQRSMLVQYERFVDDPRRTLTQIVELLGEDPSQVPDPHEGIFDVTETHTVSGNPRRFRSGPIEVRQDDEWRDRMGLGQKLGATLFALPLLHRYGYPIIVRRAEPNEPRENAHLSAHRS